MEPEPPQKIASDILGQPVAEVCLAARALGKDALGERGPKGAPGQPMSVVMTRGTEATEQLPCYQRVSQGAVGIISWMLKTVTVGHNSDRTVSFIMTTWKV